MSIILPRRGVLLGLAAMLAAPAIVRATSIMPVHSGDPLVEVELYYQFRDMNHHVTECVERQFVRRSEIGLVLPKRKDPGKYCFSSLATGGEGIIEILPSGFVRQYFLI